MFGLRAAIGLCWAAAGCGYVCAHDNACPELEGDDEVAVAIERAARWLSRQSVRGEEAFFLRQGAAELGGPFEAWAGAIWVDPSRSKGVDGRMAWLGQRRFGAVTPAVTPTPTGTAPSAAPISLDDRNLGFVVVSMATRCDRLDEDETRDFGRKLGRRSHSYLATAQLWAAVTAHHLDCGDELLFERRRRLIGNRVYAELIADPDPHDLTAERMAVLDYAGFGASIPPEYYRRLAQAQHPVGAWIDPHWDGGPYARPTTMHMTSVAFYALARERNEH